MFLKLHNKKWVQCHQWQWAREREGSLEKTGSGFSLTGEFQEGVEGLNLLRKEVKTEGKQWCLGATNMVWARKRGCRPAHQELPWGTGGGSRREEAMGSPLRRGHEGSFLCHLRVLCQRGATLPTLPQPPEDGVSLRPHTSLSPERDGSIPRPCASGFYLAQNLRKVSSGNGVETAGGHFFSLLGRYS